MLQPVDAWNPSLAGTLPEFWHIDAVLEDFARHEVWPDLEVWGEKAVGVTNTQGAPVRFVAHAPRKRGGAWTLDSMYDAHIFLRGEVPSRPCNWHDFFNMAIWRTFPKAKAAINRAQWEALQRWLPGTSGAKLPGARRPEQDTLALLDEGGVIVAVTGSSDAQLSEEDAATAIANGRATVILFGHALLEHVVTGHGEVRGASVVLSRESWPSEPRAFLDAADAALAARVEAGASVRRGERGLSLGLARKHHDFRAMRTQERREM